MTRIAGNVSIAGPQDALAAAADDVLLAPIPPDQCAPLVVETRSLDRRLADLFAATAHLCS